MVQTVAPSNYVQPNAIGVSDVNSVPSGAGSGNSGGGTTQSTTIYNAPTTAPQANVVNNASAIVSDPSQTHGIAVNPSAHQTGVTVVDNNGGGSGVISPASAAGTAPVGVTAGHMTSDQDVNGTVNADGIPAEDGQSEENER